MDKDREMENRLMFDYTYGPTRSDSEADSDEDDEQAPAPDPSELLIHLNCDLSSSRSEKISSGPLTDEMLADRAVRSADLELLMQCTCNAPAPPAATAPPGPPAPAPPAAAVASGSCGLYHQRLNRRLGTQSCCFASSRPGWHSHGMQRA
jgi:hypothetical protein